MSEDHPQCTPQLLDNYLARQALRRVGDYAAIIAQLRQQVAQLEETVAKQSARMRQLEVIIDNRRAALSAAKIQLRREIAAAVDPTLPEVSEPPEVKKKPRAPWPSRRARPYADDRSAWPSRKEAIEILKATQSFARLRDACNGNIHPTHYTYALLTHYWIADSEWAHGGVRPGPRQIQVSRSEMAAICKRCSSMSEVAREIRQSHATTTAWCARLGVPHPNPNHLSHRWWAT